MSDIKSGFAKPAAPAPGEFSKTRVALISTRWNVEIIDALVTGARRAFRAWGIKDENLTDLRAPGAYELPLAAHLALSSGQIDAVVALGAVIRGDTPHFDYVCNECARGLMDVQLKFGKPVAFGVLTVDTVEQATARCGVGRDNKGYEAVAAALDMIRLARTFSS